MDNSLNLFFENRLAFLDRPTAEPAPAPAQETKVEAKNKPAKRRENRAKLSADASTDLQKEQLKEAKREEAILKDAEKDPEATLKNLPKFCKEADPTKLFETILKSGKVNIRKLVYTIARSIDDFDKDAFYLIDYLETSYKEGKLNSYISWDLVEGLKTSKKDSPVKTLIIDTVANYEPGVILQLGSYWIDKLTGRETPLSRDKMAEFTYATAIKFLENPKISQGRFLFKPQESGETEMTPFETQGQGIAEYQVLTLAADTVVATNPELLMELALKVKDISIKAFLLKRASTAITDTETKDSKRVKTFKENQEKNEVENAKAVLSTPDQHNKEDIAYAQSLLLLEDPVYLLAALAEGKQERNPELFKSTVLAAAVKNPTYTIGLFDSYKNEAWAADALAVMVAFRSDLARQVMDICLKATENLEVMKKAALLITELNPNVAALACSQVLTTSEVLTNTLNNLARKYPLIALDQLRVDDKVKGLTEQLVLNELIRKFGLEEYVDLIRQEDAVNNITIRKTDRFGYITDLTGTTGLLAAILEPDKLIFPIRSYEKQYYDRYTGRYETYTYTKPEEELHEDLNARLTAEMEKMRKTSSLLGYANLESYADKLFKAADDNKNKTITEISKSRGQNYIRENLYKNTDLDRKLIQEVIKNQPREFMYFLASLIKNADSRDIQELREKDQIKEGLAITAAENPGFILSEYYIDTIATLTSEEDRLSLLTTAFKNTLRIELFERLEQDPNLIQGHPENERSDIGFKSSVRMSNQGKHSTKIVTQRLDTYLWNLLNRHTETFNYPTEAYDILSRTLQAIFKQADLTRLIVANDFDGNEKIDSATAFAIESNPLQTLRLTLFCALQSDGFVDAYTARIAHQPVKNYSKQAIVKSAINMAVYQALAQGQLREVKELLKHYEKDTDKERQGVLRLIKTRLKELRK